MTAAATGNIPTGFFFPEGSISFGGAAFDTIRLAATAPDFAIDNVALGTAAVPEPGTLFLCIIVVGMALRRRARQHLS